MDNLIGKLAININVFSIAMFDCKGVLSGMQTNQPASIHGLQLWSFMSSSYLDYVTMVRVHCG